MHYLRLVLPITMALFLAGCTSPEEKRTRAFSVAKSNLDRTLEGEWISRKDANDYLMFKPEADADHSGRFGGIGEFDRYRVTTKLAIGGHIEIEILSSSGDTDVVSSKISIRFAGDFNSLTLTIPSLVPGRAPVTTIYDKVRP